MKDIVYKILMMLNLYDVQDEKGNWWLRIVDKEIGYFPAALFSNMANADKVGWGGFTVTPAGSPSPPMGSGHFPNDDFIYGCYFINIAFQNESRKDYGPVTDYVDQYNDAGTECYGVEYYGDQRGDVGYSLQFGGPGGNC